MVGVEINLKTIKAERRQIDLALPIFFWKIMEKRAETCHGGNLQECLEVFFTDRAIEWCMEAFQGALPIGSQN